MARSNHDKTEKILKKIFHGGNIISTLMMSPSGKKGRRKKKTDSARYNNQTLNR
jgi:hypothetical protein